VDFILLNIGHETVALIDKLILILYDEKYRSYV